jgi:hypothetical protein
LALFLLLPPAPRCRDSYLDIQTAKVRTGKRGEFDAENKRLAEINRKHEGDRWLAYETISGTGNTIFFVSVRTGYGAAGEALAAFEGSLTRALEEAARANSWKNETPLWSRSESNSGASAGI